MPFSAARVFFTRERRLLLALALLITALPPAAEGQTLTPTATPTRSASPSSLPQPVVYDFAGSASAPIAAGAALQSGLAGVSATGVFLDGSPGALFCARHCVRRALFNGSAAVVAGDCFAFSGGFAGDGGAATAALLWGPAAGVAAPSGGLFIAEAGSGTASGGGRVRFVSVAGVISTVAGNGSFTAGAPQPLATATAQALGTPVGLALSADSATLFIADSAVSVIFALALGGAPGALSVAAGVPGMQPTGAADAGDGGPATAARVAPVPGSLVLAPPGSAWPGALLFCDKVLFTVRAVLANGTMVLVAGVSGVSATSVLGARAAGGAMMVPAALAFDAAGLLLIAEQSTFPTVRRLTAGGRYAAGWGGGSNGTDGAVNASIQLFSTSSLAFDAAHDVAFVASSSWGRVRFFAAADLVARTLAGPFAAPAAVAGLPGTAIELGSPSAIAIDAASGAVLVTDSFANIARTFSSAGVLQPAFVGGTVDRIVYYENYGDGGRATSAGISVPSGAASDGVGGWFMALSGSNFGNGSTRVLRVWANGTASTAIGGAPFVSTVPCFGGSPAPARAAGFKSPLGGLAWDNASQALYVAESGGHVVRRLDARAGVVTVFAGRCGNTTSAPSRGNGGPATSALLASPASLALDGAGNVLIGESFYVRLVNITSGIIVAFAGIGFTGSTGDGGQATLAKVSFVRGIAVDACGAVYFTESNRVRRVGVNGIITTIAGTGASVATAAGALSLNGPAASATFNAPKALAFTADGRLLIAESGGGRIRVGREGGAGCVHKSAQ